MFFTLYLATGLKKDEVEEAIRLSGTAADEVKRYCLMKTVQDL